MNENRFYSNVRIDWQGDGIYILWQPVAPSTHPIWMAAENLQAVEEAFEAGRKVKLVKLADTISEDKQAEKDTEQKAEIIRRRLYNPSAILPVGLVNLQTGKSKEWGTVWNLWEEGDGTYVLCEELLSSWETGKPKFRAVITSGGFQETVDWYPEGSKISFQHDQTMRAMGSWKVLGCYSNTKEGLRQMALKTGKTSIAFATFK